MASLRVAFVRMADFPYPNRLLPEALRDRLGADHVEVFDVEAAVRRDVFGVLVNCFFMLWQHGVNLALRRVRPWRAFHTTTWMFRRMSRHARRFIEGGAFDASIQIQSLFDAHAPGVPHFVYTDHTHLANLAYPHFDRRTLLRGSWLALETRAYHSAALVFTRSGNIDRSLVDDYGCAPEKIRCVGAGANVVPGFAGAGPAAFEAGERSPRILFVGVDWERKGGPELVRAFERVSAEVPGLELVIVGCEPELDVPGVQVVGRVAREALHAHYERASIFCLPTRREPYGVALVEAMHFGLPIVATRVGAVPEIVAEGETGLLVEPGAVDELAEALGELARDPKRCSDMGLRGQRRARRVFTWAAVAENIMGEIEGVLAGETGARADSREHEQERELERAMERR